MWYTGLIYVNRKKRHMSKFLILKQKDGYSKHLGSTVEAYHQTRNVKIHKRILK